jgi:hypothetical protein
LNPKTPELPTTFRLLGAHPNPFNPTTQIRFDLPEASEVSITVYDLLGRRLRTVGPSPMEAGRARTVSLDATGWATGPYIYFVHARAAGGSRTLHRATGRMTLLK